VETWSCHILRWIRSGNKRVNLVEWGISIAVMLRVRVVDSTLSFVGSGRRSTVTATGGSQCISGWNETLKVVLSLWNGEIIWRCDYAKYIGRATIDLESKIRTAEENLILLPKKKTIVSVCTTNVTSYVCLFISKNHLLQQRLILDFLHGIVKENAFFACLFLESIKYLTFATKPAFLRTLATVDSLQR